MQFTGGKTEFSIFCMGGKPNFEYFAAKPRKMFWGNMEIQGGKTEFSVFDKGENQIKFSGQGGGNPINLSDPWTCLLFAGTFMKVVNCLANNQSVN